MNVKQDFLYPIKLYFSPLSGPTGDEKKSVNPPPIF